ncbi:MAG: InlB B-repeat-containing protein, partial [Tissierellia bacterium]|nr:InlB B-repeat-containing protein [Tissierellia bacterium]
MNNIKKWKEFLYKKLSQKNKKPRYATRKLSIGLVSCMIGFLVFMPSNIVRADGMIEDINKEVITIENPKEESELVEDGNDSEETLLEEPETKKDTLQEDESVVENSTQQESETAQVEEPPKESSNGNMDSLEGEKEVVELNKPEKTTVQDKNNLSQKEKESVIDAIRAANNYLTEDIEIIVTDNGDARFEYENQIYELKSEDTIKEVLPQNQNKETETELSEQNKVKEEIQGKINTDTKSTHNELHFDVNGETKDGVLRYAGTNYRGEDEQGIKLTVSKWATQSTSWGNIDKGPYNGRYLLNFFDDEFYSQIEAITVNGIAFQSESGGALWKVPINSKTFSSGLIGLVTNDDIYIKLKNGQTLTSLGYADKKIIFKTVWVRGDGLIDYNGNDEGFILKDNTTIPEKNEDNFSKVQNFTTGEPKKKVYFNVKDNLINSVVTFKPDENYLQSDYNWVVYVNEKITPELFKYIDTDNIYIVNSDLYGNANKGRIKFKLTYMENKDGYISTRFTPDLSIMTATPNDKQKLKNARHNTNQIFWGTLGQSRNFVIQYGIKNGIKKQEFAKALNDYIKEHGQITFESWFEVDYLDSKDKGEKTKWLQNSYATSFIEVFDSDKDTVYDFAEEEVGLNKYDIDTDGDGTPDNVEFADENIDGKDGGSFHVNPPKADKDSYNNAADVVINGKFERNEYIDPSKDDGTKVKVTNSEAYNVIIKAYKYDEKTGEYDDSKAITQTTLSEDSNGQFKLNIVANTLQDGEKLVLVAFSPNGKVKSKLGTIITFEDPKVIFDANGGKYEDDTTSKDVKIKNNTVQAPIPTREGYAFLGWSENPKANQVQEGVLTGLTETKTVYAVWEQLQEGLAETIEPKVPGTKVEVEDKTSLTAEEKAEVKKAVEEANKDIADKIAKIEVSDTGDVTITYKDDSTDTIEGKKVVKEREKTTAETIEPKVPGTKVEVEDK